MQNNLVGGGRVPLREVYVVCNSLDDKSSSSNTNFGFSFAQVDGGQETLTDLTLVQAIIPNEFGNVYAQAQKLHVATPTATDIIISPGHYTEAQLIAELESQFVAIPGITTCSITKDPITGFWTITCDAPFSIDSTLSDSFIYTIGWIWSDGQDPSPNTTFTLEGTINLNRPHTTRIYLDGLQFQTMDAKSLTTTKLLHEFYLGDTEYGAIGQFIADVGTCSSFRFPEHRSIVLRIRITDEFDVPLTLPSNKGVQLRFKAGLNTQY